MRNAGSRLYREAHPEEFQDAPTNTVIPEPPPAAAHPTAGSSTNPYQVLDTEGTQVLPPDTHMEGPEIVVIPPTQGPPPSPQPGTRPGMRSEDNPRRDNTRNKKKAARRRNHGRNEDDDDPFDEMDFGPPEDEGPSHFSGATYPAQESARPKRRSTNPDYTYAHAYDGITPPESTGQW